MQRKKFLKQTGLILGALPTLGAASLPAISRFKIPTTYDPMNWSEVRDQFALRRTQIHISTFLLASHPRPVAEASVDKILSRTRNAITEHTPGWLRA